MEYTLIIKGKLSGLNDYIRALDTSRYKGSALKRKNETRVLQAVYEQHNRLRISKPVRIEYLWVEPNRKRDKDNVSSFGRKVIQDALVQAKVLQNDGWSCIVGFSDRFEVDRSNPRVEITIREVEK